MIIARVNIRIMIIVSANITIMIIAPVNIRIMINCPADKTNHKIMIILIIIAPADLTICNIP